MYMWGGTAAANWAWSGGSCTMDGMATPCGQVLSYMQMGAAAQCPDNACSTFGVDPLTGGGAILSFVAGAGGATGYLSAYDRGQGLNEIGGAFLTNSEYNAYILATYAGSIGAQRIALASKMALNSGGHITYQAAYDSLSTANGYLEGGNYNFVTSFGPNWLICGGDARCNGVHFPGQDPDTGNWFVHLDTSNPWASFGGFWEHAFVDVFLGNTAYTSGVIPRPFP